MEQRDEVKEIMFTEYDEEAVLKIIGQDHYEDGYADGREAGVEHGIQQTLVMMVKKKYERNMSTTDIAQMLELEEEKVEEIIREIEA